MFKKIKKFYLDSLSACNEDCLFCTKKDGRVPQRNLTTEESKREIKKAAQEGFQELHFDGGEPTLRNDLAELISFAEKLGFKKICILTNAFKFSNKNFTKKIANAFQKTRPTFSVSLHSHKKEVSEYLVNTSNTFEKTIEGIQNLIDIGAYVFIYHIIAKQNYKDLAGFVEFISQKFPKTCGEQLAVNSFAVNCSRTINYIIFSFIYPTGAALKNKHIFPKLSLVEPYLLKASNLCQKKDIRFGISSCGMVPLCFLKGYEQYIIAQQALDQPQNIKLASRDSQTQYQLATKEFHTKTKVKPKQCNSCLLNNYCAGLWKAYAEMYGTEELKPIRDKRQVEKIRQILKTNF